MISPGFVKSKEIDSRILEGNTGDVQFFSTFDGAFEVDVYDSFGNCVAALRFEDYREALEAYHHPFSNALVPNIFDKKYRASRELEIHTGFSVAV